VRRREVPLPPPPPIAMATDSRSLSQGAGKHSSPSLSLSVSPLSDQDRPIPKVTTREDLHPSRFMDVTLMGNLELDGNK
jgi:hypothetical protein